MNNQIRSARFHLSAFRSDVGYDRGRSLPWQVAWHAVNYLVFMQWWCPKPLRVKILRAFGATVGSHVQIRQDVHIHWPWKLTIGDHVWVGVGARLLNLEPIVIGDNVCVSQESFLSTGSHDYDSVDFRFANAPIEIGSGSWLALRSTVLAGTRIPPSSVVPAGQIVHASTFGAAPDAQETLPPSPS